MDDKGQQLKYFKEKLNKQLDSVKELLGEYRYKVFSVMVNTCEDYDELKMMADIEMQLDSLEYTKKRVKDRLDKRDVSIKDIKLSTDRVQREIKKFEIIEPEEQRSVISKKFDIITPDTFQNDIESDDILEEAFNSVKYSATMTPVDEAKYLRELQEKMQEISNKRIADVDLDVDFFGESDIDGENEDEDTDEDDDLLDEMFEADEEDVLNSIPDEEEEPIDLDPDTEDRDSIEDNLDSMFEEETEEEMSYEDKINSVLDDESLFDDYDDEDNEDDEDDEDAEEESSEEEYPTEYIKDESELISDGLDEIFEDTEDEEEDTLESSLDEFFDEELDDEEDEEQDIFEDEALSNNVSLSDSIDDILGDTSLFEDDTESDTDETESDDEEKEDPFASFEDDFMGDDDVSVEEDVYNNILSQPKDKSLLSNASSVSSNDIQEIKPKAKREVAPNKVFIGESSRSESTQKMFNMLCGLFDKSEITAKSLIKKTGRAASKSVTEIKKSSLINF